MPVSISSSDSKLAQASISRASSAISESVSNLVTGQRKNANVADFSVGTVLSTKVEVLKTATLNAGQAKSLLNTAKGGLETIADLLTSQKNLATKSSDDSLSDNERAFLDQEFQALTKEIDRIAKNTNFNGKALINGSISGEASGTTATSETTENFSLASVGQFRLGGSVSSGNLANTLASDTTNTETIADGNVYATFNAVDSGDIGTTRARTVIEFNYDHTNTAAATEAVADATIAIDVGNGAVTVNVGSFNQTTGADNNAANGEAFAAAAATALNNSTNADVRKFNYEASGNTVIVTALDAGDSLNSATFQVNKGAADIDTVNLGSAVNDIDGTTKTITQAAAADTTNTTAGANRAGTGTFDSNLQGAIGNISATVSQEGGEKRVTFSAEVNGVTYTSNSIGLDDDGSDLVIVADQAVTFYNANGTKDSSGNLTDNGFQLNFGSTDTTIGSNASTLTQVQNSLNTLAGELEDQLSGATIVQERAIATTPVATDDNDISATVGTVLEGLKGYNTTGDVTGAVRVRSDSFGDDGSFGSIGAFNYDKDTFKLTATVDGVTYTADLSDSSTAGTAALNSDLGLHVDNDGGGSNFNTTTKALTIDDTDTVQIVLNSGTEGDSNQLILELANGGTEGGLTTSIDLSTETAATNFAATLNEVFGVAENNSLSFQVGSDSTDSIGVSIGGATTSDLYKDDSNVSQTLNIATLDGAKEAGDVLDNAINSVISLISDVDAAISSFDSAIANNEASIQNADAARSVLLDTDYSKESTEFTEATVKADAASAILAQVNSRVGKLLQLLRF